MTQILFASNGLVSLGAVNKEEDLKPRGLSINPPPEDGRCDVCGRPMSELKPYGGPGDPLVGDFSGELLVKRWRRDAPYDAEAEEAWKRAEEMTNEEADPLPWFIANYGEEKGERLYWAGQLYDTVGKSWECRDCIVLGEGEYFEQLAKRCREYRNE